MSQDLHQLRQHPFTPDQALDLRAWYVSYEFCVPSVADNFLVSELVVNAEEVGTYK